MNSQPGPPAEHGPYRPGYSMPVTEIDLRAVGREIPKRPEKSVHNDVRHQVAAKTCSLFGDFPENRIFSFRSGLIV